MLGLALEGGGSRGSYHIGVYKAFLENGYQFDGFVGTSIGAVNASILAQGDFELLYELWNKVTMSELFYEHDEAVIEFGLAPSVPKNINNITKSIKKVVETGGIDTTKMRAFLESVLDEPRLRASKKDYGLSTIALSDRKNLDLNIESIPEGMLVDYIMASCALPGFKPVMIENKAFLDGGLHNNCPINLLLDKGYDEIIAVRTLAPGVFRKHKATNAKVTIISPAVDLGKLIHFDHEIIDRNINQGYYDGLRAIYGLKGRNYYIKMADNVDFFNLLLNVEDSAILKAAKQLEITPAPIKRMLFEGIVPAMGAHLKLNRKFDYSDLLIAMLERCALDYKLDRFKVYEYREFLSELRVLLEEKPENDGRKNSLKDIINAFMVDRYSKVCEIFASDILKQQE